MANSKTSSKVKPVAEVESATEASVQPLSAEAVAVSRSVVVLAFPGTVDGVRAVWMKFCSEDLHFREVPSDEKLIDTLAEVIADNSVAADFVLIPSNLIPVRPVSWEELSIPTEDVSSAGVKVWGRTPVRFDKDVLASLLPELPNTGEGEEFVREYQKRTVAGLRHQVAHDFGNYYTKVLRSEPCEHALMEGFVRKHFIYSSAAGWPAVRQMSESTILGR